MQLLNEKYKTILNESGINTRLRLAHFFAQIKAESQLKPISENLNYSVESLIKNFGRHRISVADANKYGYNSKQKSNQEMLANILYGGDWGKKNLGNTEHGDGWKYRGRGFKQITGRANYAALSKFTGIDYLNNPDLLLNEADAMNGALWFWSVNDLNKFADLDNLDAISDIINKGNRTAAIGDANGYDKRKLYLSEFKKEFAS